VGVAAETIEQWFEPWDGLRFAERLLASWDELEPEPEQLRDPALVTRFLSRHGLYEAAALADGDDLAALRALRDRLAAAWDADSDERAVELLNRVVADSPARPRLVRESGAWQFRFDRPGEPVSRFAGGLAAGALLEEIRLHGRRRLGRCAGAPCRCAFVDRSRNRSKRYCCDLCADRVNQAAARRRR
jgi:predicted RNA-binding Zn ribbon-like protein